jgi:hypothetical protein
MRSTPFGNNLLAEFAMKAIESEELGKIILLIFLRLVSLQQTMWVIY